MICSGAIQNRRKVMVEDNPLSDQSDHHTHKVKYKTTEMKNLF